MMEHSVHQLRAIFFFRKTICVIRNRLRGRRLGSKIYDRRLHPLLNTSTPACNISKIHSVPSNLTLCHAFTTPFNQLLLTTLGKKFDRLLADLLEDQ